MTTQDFQTPVQTQCNTDASPVRSQCEADATPGATSGASSQEPLKLPASLKQIAAYLEISEANLKNKWFSQRIVPIYEGYECPALRNEQGVTEFGFQAIQRFHLKVIRGGVDYDQYVASVRESLNPIEPEKPATAADAMLQKAAQLRAEAEQRKSALALRNQEASGQLATAQQATEATKELLSTMQANLQAEREAAEAEEEAEIQLRVLARLTKELEIERKMRAELGLGK